MPFRELSADPYTAAVAADLKAHRGTGLVLAGDSQPPAIHVLAHAINEALGNAGTTVSYVDSAVGGSMNQTAALTELVSDMKSGKVGMLVILGGNPVFTAPADLGFGKRHGARRAADPPGPLRR